jgi:hypothetical protein
VWDRSVGQFPCLGPVLDSPERHIQGRFQVSNRHHVSPSLAVQQVGDGSETDIRILRDRPERRSLDRFGEALGDAGQEFGFIRSPILESAARPSAAGYS